MFITGRLWHIGLGFLELCNSDRFATMLCNFKIRNYIHLLQSNNSFVTAHLNFFDNFIPLLTWDNRRENIDIFQVYRDITIVPILS